ncbi:MAG: acyl-CoA dehydrogenase family protein [Proteobacteria bacterium]|nr:acyl-CoA dehydrogenase family protein [Pseudomonadota bacterium]
MDFSIDENLQNQLDQSQDFVREKIFPLETLLLNQQWQELYPALEQLRLEVKNRGWWSPHLTPSLGGHFKSLVNLGLISEVIGQSPLGHYVFGSQAPDAGNAELLHLYADETIKQNYLLPLVAGKIRSCFAMTEPHTAGSNPTLLESTATIENNHWLINGTKWFTTSADQSEFTIIMAITDPDAHRHKKASMIIVPMNTPGLRIIRNIPVMGHAGSGYFSHAEIEFKNCKVPFDNILGERGTGFKMAQQRLGPGRIHHCMRWMGIARRSLDLMCSYVKQRKINSTETLADQQIIKTNIAESTAQLYAARALILETAWMIDNLGFDKAKQRVSMIKYHAANVLQGIVDKSLQAHGALGMTDDIILAFFYREERAARIYDGPDEVHKLSVAKQILAEFV